MRVLDGNGFPKEDKMKTWLKLAYPEIAKAE
jgi:hypothetical protein